MAAGIITKSSKKQITPSCKYFTDKFIRQPIELMAYRTDDVALVQDPSSYTCAQFAVMAATALSAQELGMVLVEPSEESSIPFKFINECCFGAARGLGNLFRLRKLDYDILRIPDIFKVPNGVYIIHCFHYHEEDIEFEEDVEGIPHYIVYNAGTRVLHTNPEVLVLEDKDIEDVYAFVEKLKQKPYLLKLPVSVKRFARQLFFLHTYGCQSLRFNTPEQLMFA